ncbi:MAG: ABC transporter ATP-binding protein [Anaerolineae bacterium]|nr:ABC transporter ATP-binding protein [Anaerolineae bacterium]
MPTIVLRHVTKRYGDGDPENTTGMEKLITSSARIFDHRHAQKQEMREPSNRPHAVNDLSLTIRDGETLSIIGPSGCGKTTLLKIIAGLLKPTSGDVFYDSRAISDIPMAERGIGMVFQNYALYPHMQAWENIGFYDIIRKQPEKIPERIKYIIRIMGVELEHLLSRKPPTLSGGEQQRVAVARCLARDPQIFLFDEPLSNLDAKLRVETRAQINRLLHYYKITAIYVTHDQTEAIAISDRIAIMRAGKIEQIGTFHALYDTPKNAFVAQFFGNPPMNLFAGHIWDDVWEGRGFTVQPIRPGLRQGQAVWLGIRPEHITIVPADGIPATIDHIEAILTHRQQLLYTNIAGQTCVVSVDLDQLVARGDTINLEFNTQNLYLFDKDTGARIG